MNRTLDQAAALLNVGPRKLRQRLRVLGILNHAGELTSRYREAGHLFTDCRSRWNPAINAYAHYGVVMVTERGLRWLADQLGVSVSQKDAA
ncbi:phage antirepressor KilAC domain-containing protein [Atopomonas sediminilitoris]|uniref:phage antirepressor KilAC domain-containing protein n=1 Tax=Atopomonas sediminilitoris TaxID=2919919 RepID=UPI001F4D7013|nr:phage antirepressor KilAC domain-containing protein [Atopomonas sediminilitoris]MCJ8168658.1 phage antirepressor KilAC domain-containing protein [Atopomonas sediminilitoris]